MTRATYLFVTLICLSILPLQQTQAFFCFKFVMGGRSGHQAPRYMHPDVQRYTVPHPSYFLSQPRYSPRLAYPYIPQNLVTPTRQTPTTVIPTP